MEVQGARTPRSAAELCAILSGSAAAEASWAEPWAVLSDGGGVSGGGRSAAALLAKGQAAAGAYTRSQFRST